MSEINKLIEYAEIAGFPLSVNGDKLVVKNGRKFNIPYQLNKLLKLHKDEILHVLKNNEKRIRG